MRQTSSPAMDEASSTVNVSSSQNTAHSSLLSSTLRLLLVLSIVTGGVLLAFLGSASHTLAATDTPTTANVPVSQPIVNGLQKADQLSLTLAKKYPAPTKTPAPAYKSAVQPLTASSGFNGLGDLPFYTYISKRNLTDQLSMKVNVANGNVLLNTSELSVKGTGIDMAVGSTYNSEESSNALLDDGNSWFFNTGRGVTVDLSNLSSGITLHGPSDYSAFFPANGSGGFSDNYGINASIKSSGNGTYRVTFHKTGEYWGFNNYGSRLIDCDKNANCLQFSYGSNGDLNTITDTQKRQVTVTHGSDSSNNLHQVTSYNITTSDGLSKTITHGYSSFQFTTLTNTDQKSTTFAYDSNGRIKTITDPQNHSTSFAYTSDGKIQTITDANSKTLQFAYYASGNSACSGLGTTSLSCTVVTDQNGHSTTYGYDTSLEVSATKNALGYTSSQTYDATKYNVNSTTDALTNTDNFTYDPNNNLTSSKDATGVGTTYTYAAPNQTYYPDTSLDAQNNQTDYTYDTNGNILTAMDHSTSKGLTYTYNSSNGTIASQKDANGNVTTYGYDSLGNLTTVTPPAPMGKTTITYDGLSRVKTETDGNNHKTTFTYDAIDRVQSVTYNDGTSVSYTYDGAGNVLTETDHTGTTTFTYDPLNREITKLLPGSGSLITNGYDNVGNLTSLNDGTGTTTYAYNQVNDMTTLTDPGNAQTTYGYDKDNRKISIAYPNGTGELMTYDAAGHETSVKGGKTSGSGTSLTVTTAYLSATYSYINASSKATALMQSEVSIDPTTPTNQYKWAYTYDSQNRLTEANRQIDGSGTVNQDWQLTYDPNGNMTKKVYTGSSNYIATYSSYNADNQPTSATSSGNYAGKAVSGSATYSYDGNGNLTAITNGGTTEQALSLPQTHTYNASNQDVSGSGTASGSTQTYSFSYSGTNQTDRVSNNGATTVYTSLGLSTETSSSGTNEYVRCSCGLLNSERVGGKSYYYLFDAHGSILGMTDSSGNDVNRYAFDPFGAIANSSTISGLNNPWQYAGGYYDATTGLIKFGIRYYDPQFGRWTQATPIGGSLQEALKANPYEYADDNPVNETDESGRFPVILALVIAGCIGGGFGNVVSNAYPAGNNYTFSDGVKDFFAGCIVGAIGGPLLAAVATTAPLTAGISDLAIATFGPFATGAAIGEIRAWENIIFP